MGAPKKTVCIRGHDLSVTRKPSGGCRTCAAIRARGYYSPKHREYAHQWQLEHRDRVRAQQKARYAKGYRKTAEWRKRHPGISRSSMLRTKYGIDDAVYAKMLADQNGKCAICGKPEHMMAHGKISPLTVDHDHLTLAVRGLLCRRCNMGLGAFEDELDNVRMAARYLEGHRKA